MSVTAGIPFSRWGAQPFIIAPFAYPVDAARAVQLPARLLDGKGDPHPFELAFTWKQELAGDEKLTVAQNDLAVSILPEAGVLVPGVENILYVLAAYPDGTPAKCKVLLNGSAFQGDPQGVSEVRVTPEKTDQEFEFVVQDQNGKRRSLTFRGETNRVVPMDRGTKDIAAGLGAVVGQ